MVHKFSFVVCALALSLVDARPQFNLGNLFQAPKTPDANLPTAVSVGGAALTGLLAFNNIRQGNDRIKVKPAVNLVYNPRTGQLEPALTLNGQIGQGAGSTSLGIGGTLSEGNIAPIATTAINGPEVGGVASPAVVSGFTFNNGHTDAVVGGQISTDHVSHDVGNVGNFGNIGGFLNGRRRRSITYYY